MDCTDTGGGKNVTCTVVTASGENIESKGEDVGSDNGAQITVCSSGTVSGEVRNGAQLTVLCGGSITGVETSDGGTVSSAP